MRITCTFFLLMLAICSCAQDEETDDPRISKHHPMFRIARSYFRSNPYEVHFSTFLNHLVNDPTLSNKTLKRRTDTSLFSFKGEYTTHNPYTFKPDKVEVRLLEGAVNLKDSLSSPDTLLFYQLLGYSYGQKGIDAVSKEFERFQHKYGHDFAESEISELKQQDRQVGLVKNYFTSLTDYSPLSISWIKLDNNQSVFTITFRIKVVKNIVTLPMSSESDE